MPSATPEGPVHSPGAEYVELQRLIFRVLWSLVLLIALTVVMQASGGSLTLGALLIDCSTSLSLHIFNMVSIGIIVRQNAFSHPYGTGKLENFAGFLYAALAIPGGLWILYAAYQNHLQPPAATHLGPATLVILFSLTRSVWLFRMAQQIVRRYAHSSPMTKAYLVDLRVASVTDLLLLTGVLAGFGVSFTDHGDIAIYFDRVIATLQGLYLLRSAIVVLLNNFKSLIDLPLPEDDQLKIMQTLTAHFDAFEDIGNIYTKLSGSTCLVQIELYVTPDTNAAEIQLLSANMERQLKQHFGKLLFHLIPLVKQGAT